MFVDVFRILKFKSSASSGPTLKTRYCHEGVSETEARWEGAVKEDA